MAIECIISWKNDNQNQGRLMSTTSLGLGDDLQQTLLDVSLKEPTL